MIYAWYKSYWVYDDEVLPYMHNVGLCYYMMKVSFGMYDVVYTFHIDVWSKF